MCVGGSGTLVLAVRSHLVIMPCSSGSMLISIRSWGDCSGKLIIAPSVNHNNHNHNHNNNNIRCEFLATSPDLDIVSQDSRGCRPH